MFDLVATLQPSHWLDWSLEEPYLGLLVSKEQLRAQHHIQEIQGICPVSLIDHPISQTSLDISPIWTPIIAAEVRKLHTDPCSVDWVWKLRFMLVTHRELVSSVISSMLITQGLALSIGPNWRRRQNRVSEMLCVVLNNNRTIDNVQKHSNFKGFLSSRPFRVHTSLGQSRVIVVGRGSHDPIFFVQHPDWFYNIFFWFIYFLDLWVKTFALKCLGKIFAYEMRSSKIQIYHEGRLIVC
jgi:hypothetical protein